MKFKITWPVGIIIAMTSFIVFILSYVYKATFVKKYDHQLVSEVYYKDELNYQHEIDELNKAALLKQDITLKKNSDGLEVNFPKEFDFSKISGTISLQRPSNNKIDIQEPIQLTSNQCIISKDKLVDGIYNVKIEWKVGTDTYMFKEKLMY